MLAQVPLCLHVFQDLEKKEESLDQFIERLFLGAGPSVLPASTLHTGPILRPTFELFAPVVEHTIILTF